MQKKQFKFYKKPSGEWWLILPEWKGDPDDLQMIEGADKWLELMAKGKKEIGLEMSDKPYSGAEVLTLLRIREENLGGGGIYYLETYGSEKVKLKLWLCEVTSFVFDCIPQKLYFKKLG
ncbi:MAG: hypothetical protein EOP00_14155 [Pedobacter sp.]|nr:MAG: hypothetical protein EOP00_14155 [Pedobacter sp.]